MIVNKEKNIYLLTIFITVVFSASFPTDNVTKSHEISTHQFQQVTNNSSLIKRARQEDDDDDDGIVQRITKGFSRVIATAFAGTMQTVFGKKNEDGDREDGILPNALDIIENSPLKGILENGAIKPKTISTNGTKKSTAVTVTAKKITKKPTAIAHVENEEDDDEEYDDNDE